MRPCRRRIRRRPPAMSGHHTRRFVKIILPSAIHGTKTRIPEEFIRSFGDELSDFATITVPDGRSWKMGLKKCGQDVWFCTNWHQFAQYYSISYGSVLTFKYKGDSQFGVRIHDTSATEIRYPSPRIRSRLEITEDDHVNLPGYKNQSPSTSLGRTPRGGKSPQCNRKGNSSSSSPERPKGETATKLKPKNPYFQATIRSCNVYIPAEFAAKHLKLKESIKLQNWNRETWDAACSCHCGRSAAMRIGRGWSRFARDNRVSAGDVCVFQLIKRRPVVVLRVEIISRGHT